MAGNESSIHIKQVDSVQAYIKSKYSDNIGLATSILGQVLLGTLRGTKRRKEVIKLCSKDMKQQFVDRVAENPRNEIAFMRKVCSVGHPGLVSFIDAVEDKKLYCLCLEYVPGGDLCTHLQNKRSGLSNELSQRYALQLAQAVYFMHCNGYCHLDISLENVLWDKKHDVVKLCDFGLCRRFPQHGDKSQLFPAANIRPGKKGYIAPEIYAYQRFNGEKADVFSLGVLIFILLTGFPPFTTPNASDKCFQYMYYGKLEWLVKQWQLDDVINADCRALLGKIFCHPNKRIGMRDMLQHPWMKANHLDEIDAQIRVWQKQMAAAASASDTTPPSSPPPTTTTTTTTPTTTTPTTTATTTKMTTNADRTTEPPQQPSSSSSLPTKKRKSITSIVKKKRLSKHPKTTTTTTAAPVSTSPSSASKIREEASPVSHQHHSGMSQSNHLPKSNDCQNQTIRRRTDTQLISEMQQCKLKQHTHHDFDDDRKEGDDETYPSDGSQPQQHERNSVTSCDEERRYSMDSQPAPSAAHGSNEYNDNDPAAPLSMVDIAAMPAAAAVTTTANIEEPITPDAHSDT